MHNTYTQKNESTSVYIYIYIKKIYGIHTFFTSLPLSEVTNGLLWNARADSCPYILGPVVQNLAKLLANVIMKFL